MKIVKNIVLMSALLLWGYGIYRAYTADSLAHADFAVSLIIVATTFFLATFVLSDDIDCHTIDIYHHGGIYDAICRGMPGTAAFGSSNKEASLALILNKMKALGKSADEKKYYIYLHEA